jgi:hypothetical protein
VAQTQNYGQPTRPVAQRLGPFPPAMTSAAASGSVPSAFCQYGSSLPPTVQSFSISDPVFPPPQDSSFPGAPPCGPPLSVFQRLGNDGPQRHPSFQEERPVQQQIPAPANGNGGFRIPPLPPRFSQYESGPADPNLPGSAYVGYSPPRPPPVPSVPPFSNGG